MTDLIAHIMVNKTVRGAMTFVNNKYGLRLRYNAVRNILSNEMIYGSYKGNPNYCEPYVTTENRRENTQNIRR